MPLLTCTITQAINLLLTQLWMNILPTEIQQQQTLTQQQQAFRVLWMDWMDWDSLVWKFPRTLSILCRKLMNWLHIVVTGALLPNRSEDTWHSWLRPVTNEVKNNIWTYSPSTVYGLHFDRTSLIWTFWAREPYRLSGVLPDPSCSRAPPPNYTNFSEHLNIVQILVHSPNVPVLTTAGVDRRVRLFNVWSFLSPFQDHLTKIPYCSVASRWPYKSPSPNPSFSLSPSHNRPIPPNRIIPPPHRS